VLGGITFVALPGLKPGAYYGKRWCGSEVDVFKFTAATATPELTLHLTAPAGAVSCQVEYGPTAALGSSTTAVPATNNACSITAPSAAYWRPAFLSATGDVISRGNIERRGL